MAIYKARIRPLIKYGQLYRILPRPDGIGWDGMEYFDSYKKNGLVFLFKGSTTESTNKIKLKGLESSHSYTLTFQDCSNPVITKSGAELMNDGINVILDGVFLSELIWIEGNFGC